MAARLSGVGEGGQHTSLAGKVMFCITAMCSTFNKVIFGQKEILMWEHTRYYLCPCVTFHVCKAKNF